jgi:hypothetical protein
MMAIAAAALAIAAPAAPAFAQERIAAPVGGISIEKPQGWHLIPPDEALSNMKTFDFDDPATAQTLQAPLITIMRTLPAETAGIIPTIKISYVRYPAIATRGPIGAIEDMIAQVRSVFPDLRMLDAPQPVTVAGRESARASVVFSLRSGNEVTQIQTDIILVPRGKAGFFSIGFAGLADDAPKNRKAFEAALESVRFDAQ